MNAKKACLLAALLLPVLIVSLFMTQVIMSL